MKRNFLKENAFLAVTTPFIGTGFAYLFTNQIWIGEEGILLHRNHRSASVFTSDDYGLRRGFLQDLVSLLDLLVPAMIFLGGIGAFVSIYRSLYYGWYFTVYLHASLYLSGVLLLLFRRRLPVLFLFTACLSLVAVDSLHSLANMGLVSIGFMSLAVLCTFSGVFFGLKYGLLSLAVALVAILTIGSGICYHWIPTQPDMVRHLTEPITWLIQISCFILYLIPLLLTADFVQKKMIHSLNQAEESKARIENEIQTRKKAECKLQESEKKYRSVVDHSLAGFFIMQDNLFRFVNPQFCRMLGYGAWEVLDRLSPVDLIHPEEAGRTYEKIKACLEEETLAPEQVLNAVRKDGEKVALKVLMSRIRYNGKPAVSGTLIDISKETSLESQLRHSQKMEAIGTLAGGIAHDFNNILSSINGNGTLLQSKLGKDNPLRLYVDQILSASDKAAALTQKILTFGRRQPISLQPLEINHQVKETENLLKRLITEDVLFQTELTPENPVILADATQIDQILFNLVTNARDAMPGGGTLKIVTRIVELDREFILTHGFGKKGAYVLLEVADTGIGMAEDVRIKVFDPFFTTKTYGKGTGLGLSTVYGIVKQHGGYIVVYSRPDQGTAFQIYLPLSKIEGKTREPFSSRPERKGTETILIADDDETVRQMLAEILSLSGYTVLEAMDGLEAIEKFHRCREISLIILDQMMPRKNGLEAFREIKKANPAAKILLMSGYTSDRFIGPNPPEGAPEFISKPISPSAFLLQVGNMLDR